MEFNTAMTESINKSLQEFLLKDMEDEEICFAIWYPAEGKKRYSILIREIVLPQEGDRKRHGNVSAFPQYVDRVKEIARQKGGGVVMIHTHPFGSGWQGVSGPDLYYEQKILSREIFGITGLPLVGITLAGDGNWSARIYPKPFKIQWCAAVRIVGKNLIIHYNPKLRPPTRSNQKQLRTTSVWGEERQSDIMRMKVGIIGSGSVGSAIGEILARVGVGKILLMDYDKVKLHNLDRMNNTTKGDVGKKKVDVIKKNLIRSATNDDFICDTSDDSVVEEAGYQSALDCDVIFSCVDRPWPRQVLNHLSYSCLIPIIDGGISFDIPKGKLVHGMYRAQTVGPERACMNCLGAYNSGQVQMDRDGIFDDPDYIKKQEEENGPSRQNIMPFVFGLAGLETIQFVELVTNITNKGDLGQQPYDYHTGEILPFHKNCVSGCEYVKITAFGDNQKPFLGIDKSRQREMKHES
jgi:hypothetical protein